MEATAVDQLRINILTTLRKLGPSSPRTIVDKVGVEQSIVSYHLRQMVKAKELKAAGTTSSRVYALPDQKIEAAPSAPPQRRKKSKGNGKRAKPKPRAPRTQPAAPLFLPAITEDWRLVIVTDGAPAVFTPEQTQAIADLLLTHFEV